MIACRFLLIVLAALGLLGLLGCNNREPPTVITINLLDVPGRVVYNGQQMGETTAKRELANLADRRRNSITNTSTGVRIVLIARNGANDARALEMADYCRSIGLNGVQFQAR